MKEEYPSIMLVKGTYHSVDLIASKAMEAMSASLEFIIKETGNYFAHSSTGQAAYKSFIYCESSAAHEKDEPLKILSPSGTRWLVIADCIERILYQYDALKEHHLSVSEKTYSVRLLKEMYLHERNCTYILFLDPKLAELRRINKLFQGEDVDPLGKLEKHLLGRILMPCLLRQHNETASMTWT